jgi:hypothetical protein
MAEEGMDDLDIVEPDSMRYGQNAEFSHEGKVSMAYDKVIIALCQENRKGYWQEKLDRKGNLLREWKSDTRDEKINSVMTLKHTLISEIESDADIKEMIRKKFEEIKKLEDDAILNEENWYRLLPINRKGAIQHYKGYINQEFIFYQNMITEKVKRCEELFEILEKLLSKFKYLKREVKVW